MREVEAVFEKPKEENAGSYQEYLKMVGAND